MNQSFRSPAREYKFADSENWIQVIRVGSFYDDRYGTLVVTSEDLLSMKKNFDAKIRKIDLALDYAHENWAEAAGWFRKVELRNGDSELWAEIEYTPQGKEKVQSKEFKYVSAEFCMRYEDNESLEEFGPTLLGAGLTNRPVVKGMAPAVALTELTDKEKEKMDKQLKELSEKVDALTKKCSDQQAELEEMKKKADEGKEPPAEQDGDMSPDDMMKKISELQAKCQAYEAELAKLKDGAALAEKSKEFDKLLADGKVCEAQRDSYLKNDTAKFAELHKAVKLGKDGHGDDGGDEETTAQDEVLKKANDLVKDGKLSMRDAISTVLSENKDLATKYRKETEV